MQDDSYEICKPLFSRKIERNLSQRCVVNNWRYFKGFKDQLFQMRENHLLNTVDRIRRRFRIGPVNQNKG